MKLAAKFSRENPCTKVHLWNALTKSGRIAATSVVDAKAIIGDNAPKYLLREGFLRQYLDKNVDWYTLTPAGFIWLTEGLTRHLLKYPAHRADCIGLSLEIIRALPKVPDSAAKKSRVIRRGRPH